MQSWFYEHTSMTSWWLLSPVLYGHCVIEPAEQRRYHHDVVIHELHCPKLSEKGGVWRNIDRPRLTSQAVWQLRNTTGIGGIRAEQLFTNLACYLVSGPHYPPLQTEESHDNGTITLRRPFDNHYGSIPAVHPCNMGRHHHSPLLDFTANPCSIMPQSRPFDNQRESSAIEASSRTPGFKRGLEDIRQRHSIACFPRALLQSITSNQHSACGQHSIMTWAWTSCPWNVFETNPSTVPFQMLQSRYYTQQTGENTCSPIRSM